MSARFSVLASGSSGNSAFLRSPGFGLLIDIGIGPRFVASRLAAVGATWRDINAVVLTHTHTDHWKDLSFGHLVRNRIPLYCSAQHQAALGRYGGNFDQMLAAGLVRTIECGESFEAKPGWVCRAIAIPHDAEPTFAYRIDGPPGLFGPEWSLGYAADLGEALPDLVEAFRDVNILALEFNHCERMQRNSGRPKILIDRVLGDKGHLSNAQASAAVREIVNASAPGALRHLVQLHLSRECNRPRMAQEAGKSALADVHCPAVVTTAAQDHVSHIIELDASFARRRPLAGVAQA